MKHRQLATKQCTSSVLRIVNCLWETVQTLSCGWDVPLVGVFVIGDTETDRQWRIHTSKCQSRKLSNLTVKEGCVHGNGGYQWLWEWKQLRGMGSEIVPWTVIRSHGLPALSVKYEQLSVSQTAANDPKTVKIQRQNYWCRNDRLSHLVIT
jgi:hypothetical protein